MGRYGWLSLIGSVAWRAGGNQKDLLTLLNVGYGNMKDRVISHNMFFMLPKAIRSNFISKIS